MAKRERPVSEEEARELVRVYEEKGPVEFARACEKSEQRRRREARREEERRRG